MISSRREIWQVQMGTEQAKEKRRQLGGKGLLPNKKRTEAAMTNANLEGRIT